MKRAKRGNEFLSGEEKKLDLRRVRERIGRDSEKRQKKIFFSKKVHFLYNQLRHSIRFFFQIFFDHQTLKICFLICFISTYVYLICRLNKFRNFLFVIIHLKINSKKLKEICINRVHFSFLRFAFCGNLKDFFLLDFDKFCWLLTEHTCGICICLKVKVKIQEN